MHPFPGSRRKAKGLLCLLLPPMRGRAGSKQIWFQVDAGTSRQQVGGPTPSREGSTREWRRMSPYIHEVDLGRAGTGRISIDAAGRESDGWEWEWGHLGGGGLPNRRPRHDPGARAGLTGTRGIEFGHDCGALAMMPSAMCATERIMASTSIKGHHVCTIHAYSHSPTQGVST